MDNCCWLLGLESIGGIASHKINKGIPEETFVANDWLLMTERPAGRPADGPQQLLPLMDCRLMSMLIAK